MVETLVQPVQLGGQAVEPFEDRVQLPVVKIFVSTSTLAPGRAPRREEVLGPSSERRSRRPAPDLDELDGTLAPQAGHGDSGQLGGRVRVDAEPASRRGQRAEGRGRIGARPEVDGRPVPREMLERAPPIADALLGPAIELSSAAAPRSPGSAEGSSGAIEA